MFSQICGDLNTQWYHFILVDNIDYQKKQHYLNNTDTLRLLRSLNLKNKQTKNQARKQTNKQKTKSGNKTKNLKSLGEKINPTQC